MIQISGLSWAVVAALLAICFALYKTIFSPLGKVPGPWYTSFTDSWLMIQEFSKNRTTHIHNLHNKYGPVVRIGPNQVAFTSPEAVKEIYTSGGSGYDKTEFYTLFSQFGLRTMFSTLNKRDHTRKKKHIASQYANTNIMRPQIMDGIQQTTKVFVKKCKRSQGQSLDVYALLRCFALDCATHFIFHPYGTHSLENEEDYQMMEEMTYHDSIMQNLGQYYWPSLSSIFAKYLKPFKLSSDYVFACCEKGDLGQETLLYKLQNVKDNLSKMEIAAECMDHLVAGIDTTSEALCCLMHQLSLPESLHIQNRLVTEIRQNKDRSSQSFPFLEAVIKEGLRCFSPIPMSQPRYVPLGGCTIDGYFIPGGTIVSCQGHSVHRLNEDVFIDGDEFIPERWLDEKKALEMNRIFMAFGIGARGCTGQNLAIAEMKCLLIEIYSRFRTRVASDMKGRMFLSDQIISSRIMDQTCRLTFEDLSIG